MAAVISYIRKYWSSEPTNQCSEKEEEEEEICESDSDSNHGSVDDIGAFVDNYVKNHDEERVLPKVESSLSGQPGGMVCQDRTGCITSLKNDYAIIDEKYHFSLDNVHVEGLEVGCRVMYSAHRHQDLQEWRVHQILSVLEEDWLEEGKEREPVPVPEAEAVQRESIALQRNIVGEVVARNGREVEVQHFFQRGREQVERITRFNLDQVSSDFTPYVGDQVSLTAWVEEDENVCDLSGEVFRVEILKPLRFRNQNTKVKSWEGTFGTVCGLDTVEETYFDRECCEKGYLPSVGDEVFIHSIESVHGAVKRFGKKVTLTWRAIWVKPTTLTNQEVSIDEIPSSQPSSEDRKLEENKHGIIVTDTTDFGVLNVGEQRDLQLEVMNNGKRPQVITRSFFRMNHRESQLKLKYPPRDARIELKPGETVRYHVICKARLFGHNKETLVIQFGRGFSIGRVLTCEVTNTHLVDALTSDVCDGPHNKRWFNREEATKSQYRQIFQHGMLVPGVRPLKPPAYVPVKMDGFPVPSKIWKAMLGNGDGLQSTVKDSLNELEKLIPCLAKSVTPATYCDRFHALLHIAEADETLEMRQYDMQRASFTKAGPGGEFLALHVPGLAEKRPSLLIGDRIKASKTWSASDTEFQGYVHKVFQNDVWIKFDIGFHNSYNGEDYKLSFETGRAVWRRSHQAVFLTLAHLGTSWLFPSSVNLCRTQVNVEESYQDKVITALPLPEETSTSKEIQNGPNEETHLSPTSSTKEIVEHLKENTLELGTRVSKQTEQGSTETEHSSESVSHESVPVKGNARLASLLAAVKRAQSMNNCPSPTVNSTEDKKQPCATFAGDTGKRVVDQSSGDSNSKTSVDVNMTDGFKAEQCLKQKSAEAQAVLLKPADAVTNGRAPTCKVNWISNLNSRQRDAVRNILKGEARPLPYIIFGPPGTGKTMTLVETILQIYLLLPDSRLLVGTPSNSSADLMAERLLDSGCLQPGDMARLVAYHVVESGKVPERLIPYCVTSDISLMAPDNPTELRSGVKSCSAHSLGRHRITVGTCVSIGQLYSMGFPRGHFTHVVVDEAGQATEPEILIPLAFLSRNGGQAILAGDPLQLGPVVQSRVALKLGLDESLLSRFLRRFPYQRDPHGFPYSGGYDPRLVTRLCINYRSLPQILDLPSSLFYDSELEPIVSDTDSIEAILMNRITEALKLPRCAVVFHGVRGSNMQEGDCPSWFNPHEVLQVTNYVTSMYSLGVTPDDIGIIAPYRKQAQKIRQMLEQLDLPLPKVGSVEEFQGQERMIIIVSTVRSSNVQVKSDVKYALGFVVSPRRLNVAISRARALLIVIGNPYLLAIDPYWRSVLNYCCNLKAYVGCDLPNQVVENSGMHDSEGNISIEES